MKNLKTLGFAILVVSAFAFVSNLDYAEQVVYNMPDASYEAVCSQLGDDCSILDIANEYMSKRAYYDSFAD